MLKETGEGVSRQRRCALRTTVGDLRHQGANVLGIRTDVSRATDVEALRDQTLSTFGAVHILCNNAGIAVGGTVADTPLQRWRWALDVNLWGVIHGCHFFLPALHQQQDGHVINTASIAGLTGHAMLGAYTASKFAVVGLSECLHHELAMAKSPIRVSVFCPDRSRATSDAPSAQARLRPRRAPQSGRR